MDIPGFKNIEWLLCKEYTIRTLLEIKAADP